MVAFEILVVSLVTAQVCFPLKRLDGRPLPDRIPLVPHAAYPESSERCFSDENRTDCPFDDSEVLAPQRLRAAASLKPVAWATAVDGGFCLPPRVDIDDVALRFPEGDWTASTVSWDGTKRSDSLGTHWLEVHAEVDGELLVTPANVLGITDGGYWGQQVLDDFWGPLAEHYGEVTFVPRDSRHAPQILHLNRHDIAKKTVVVKERAALATPEVDVRGLRQGLPVSVWLHGWPGDEDDGFAAAARAVRKTIRGMRDDGRDYVIEARQGDQRAVAVIRATTPHPVLELEPQARMRLSVVTHQGKAMNIEQVDVFEDSEGEEQCPEMGRSWESVTPTRPSQPVEVWVPPGPMRCLSVRWRDPSEATVHLMGVRVPLRPESVQLRLVVGATSGNEEGK